MQLSFRWSRVAVALGAAALMMAPLSGLLEGAFQVLRGGGSVGGVSIDASGIVREPEIDTTKQFLDDLRKAVKEAPSALAAPVPMRKVSLRGLEAAIQDAQTNEFGRLPDEVQFLGGLQRIEYVLVDRENHDIILAGPAEGWRIDETGNVVGSTSGRPVLRLDDLIVALRAANAAREVGISCSIDPTPEGVRQAQSVLDQQRRSRTSVAPNRLGPALKEAMGPQTVTITGVSPSTHFARVMLAADFHMKRLAMGVVRSPVSGLPSYIDMLASASGPMPNPRWWLACNYEGVSRNEEGTIWKVRGAGVKTLTEENRTRADGSSEAQSGRTSQLARKWADAMTEQYDALSLKMPVFGELRNVMDMSVVAAIIDMYRLREMAECPLPILFDTSSPLAAEAWHSPRSVDTVCSFAPTRGGWLVATAGGVQIESWQVADAAKPDPAVAELASHMKRSGGATWWWN